MAEDNIYRIAAAPGFGIQPDRPEPSAEQFAAANARSKGVEFMQANQTASTPVNMQVPTSSSPATSTSSISPELQAIIKQVTDMSVSPGRKIQALTSLGGIVGGIQQTGMGGDASFKRAEMSESGANLRNAAGIGSQEKIAEKNQTLKKEELGLERTKLLGIGGKGAKPLVSDSQTISGDWWSKWKL